MTERANQVLAVYPSGRAQLLRLPARSRDKLPMLQQLVGGFIEGIGVPGLWSAYLNEEGKIQQLPRNLAADDMARVLGWAGWPHDHLVGPVVFCGPPDRQGDDTNVPHAVVEAAVQAGVHITTVTDPDPEETA